MSLQNLKHAGRSPALPLSLEVAGEPLVVQQWLRTLPGQRYVGRATWRGRSVLAKLLVGSKAQRHLGREAQGAQWLHASGLPTAKLLAQGQQEDAAWLLFEFLESSQSLGQSWAAVADEPVLSANQQKVLGKALEAIAKLHGQGLWQDDLHLDNLLEYQGQIYWIDGGAVQAQTPGTPLSRDKVLTNLGVFFAQLPVSLEPFIEELLIDYVLANSTHALPLEALLKEVGRARRWRIADYLNKTGRECSLFHVQKSPFKLAVAARTDWPWLAPCLADPDRFIKQGRLCKAGGSATVAAFSVAEQALVVKRYNIKSIGHWLTRFWRPSRAWQSWRAGHLLMQWGIATAKPVALYEQRFFGLRAKAWLINQRIEGQDALSHWAQLDSLPPENELEQLCQLFNGLIRARISHGDLKGTNVLWDGHTWVLIDLDALTEHKTERSFAKAYAKDRARFLRNWPADSALHRHLDDCLPQCE